MKKTSVSAVFAALLMAAPLRATDIAVLLDPSDAAIVRDLERAKARLKAIQKLTGTP